MSVVRLGAHSVGPHRGTSFRVWAPRARSVELVLHGTDARVEMNAEGDGIFACDVKDASAGTDYAYALDGGPPRADPRSQHQPQGVSGPSRVVDTSQFLWSDAGFVCPELSAFVIYELHVGTFTVEGTFDAAIARLPHLVELGVTAVEVMPIAQFPGDRNWGYDGVFPFAPQDSYGGPAGFARFVDACHAHGLAVVLDVVYNHLGPEGNYLGEFGPYFTDRYKTDWGHAINFDGPDSGEVRRYFIDNAIYWLRDYHVDALRLDAIHAIHDASARHILEELRDEVDAAAKSAGRNALLIAESDLNDARVIRPRELGGYGMHAQWSDDFHHALRTLLIPERSGYLADFGTVSDLAQAYTDGFVYAGRYSAYRRRNHGNSSRDRPGEQFVVYTQNHDQTGNTSDARRIGTLVDLEAAKLAAAALACAPNVPLLFMGEEFLAQTPFAYFVSHSSQALLDAVRLGRASEHAAYVNGAALDPTREETYQLSKLDWACVERAPHSQVFQLYRDLLRLRREHPCLGQCDKQLTTASGSDDERWLLVKRAAVSGEVALCLFNFSEVTRWIAPARGLGHLTLALATSDIRYGGTGTHVQNTLYSPNDRDPEPIAIGPTRAVIYLRQ